VIREHASHFTLEGLALRRRTAKLEEWISEFGPRRVAIQDDAAREDWRRTHPRLAASHLVDGPVENLLETPSDIVLNAVSGFAGLAITLAAVDRGLDLALANKESLVCGGAYLMERLAAGRGRLLPVDSEHAALFQLMEGRDPDRVERLILTASGGPFRKLPEDRWTSITPEQALRHPTWKMGPRISVDSATLFNKGMEVIEAAMLFGIPEDRIEVLVHPGSRAHAMIELSDGSTLVQLAGPDMRLPIVQALSWPERAPGAYGRIDFRKSFELNFEPIDNNRFPSVELARQALRRGGSAPLALNAADEVSVAAFLEGRLSFAGIFETVSKVLGDEAHPPAESWDALVQADSRARRRAVEVVDRASARLAEKGKA